MAEDLSFDDLPDETAAATRPAARTWNGMTEDPRRAGVWRKPTGEVGYLGDPSEAIGGAAGGVSQAAIRGSSDPQFIAEFLQKNPDLAQPAADDWSFGPPAFKPDAPAGGAAPPAQDLAFDDLPDRPSRGVDAAKALGSGVLKGVTGLIDSNPFNPLGAQNLAARLTGQPHAQIAGATDLLGAVGLDYEPEYRSGRYAKTIGEFAPGAFIPGASAPSLVGKVAQTVVPAVTSEFAGQTAEDAGANPLFVAGARLAGAVVGGVGANAALTRAPAAARTAGALPAPSRSDYALAQVDPLFALEGGRGTQQVAQMVAGNPVFGAPIRRGLERTTRQVEEGVERAASGYGGGSGSFQAGEAIQRGVDPIIVARGSPEADQAAIRADLEPFVEPPPERTLVSDTLNARRDADNAGVDQAYNAARAAPPARLSGYDGREMVGRMLRSINDFDTEKAKSVVKVMNQMLDGAVLKDADLKRLFTFRERLTNIRANGERYEATAAGKAVKQFDDYIGQAMDEGIFQGDPTGVQKWRDAIGARRDFGKQWEGGDLINDLTAREQRGGGPARSVAAEDALNRVFGGAGLNLNRPDALRDLTRLRDTLGAESGAWRSIRTEALRRAVVQGEVVGANGQRNISGRRMAGWWSDLKQSNPQMADLLFGGSEQAITGAIERAVASDLRWSRPQRAVVDEFAGLTEQGAFERLQAMAKTTGASSSFPKIRQLRQAIGEEAWGDVASGMIRSMGRNGEEFSTAKFATEWQKTSPNARRALFGGPGRKGNFAELEALARIAARQRDASKLYNHSQSGNTVVGMGMASAHGAALVSAAQGQVVPLAAIAALDTMTAGASRLLASPGFARLVMAQREATNTRALERQLTAYARENPQVANEVGAFRRALTSPGAQRAMVTGVLASGAATAANADER